jgi:hypothetical protein
MEERDAASPPPSACLPVLDDPQSRPAQGELRAPAELAAARRPPRAPATRRCRGASLAWICHAQELCSQGSSVRGVQAGDGEASRRPELEEQPLDLQPEEGALLE